MLRSLALGLVLTAAILSPVEAKDGDGPTTNTSLTEAMKATKPLIDVRYRYEYKTQEGFALDANANPGDGLAEDASGNTSIRAAIMEANALAGADEIILGSGTYSLTLGSSGEHAAAQGDLDIDSEITIRGANAATTSAPDKGETRTGRGAKSQSTSSAKPLREGSASISAMTFCSSQGGAAPCGVSTRNAETRRSQASASFRVASSSSSAGISPSR